jgi:Arm DNA-binding domain
MPKLTAAGVRAETRPGRHNDGDGLYLFVRPGGSKSWVLRYRDG